MAEIGREEFDRAINNSEKSVAELKVLINKLFDKVDAVGITLNSIDRESDLLKQHVTDADYVSKAYANVHYVRNTKEFKEQQDKTGKILWFGSWWFKALIAIVGLITGLMAIFGG